jgi:hypothetical protein
MINPFVIPAIGEEQLAAASKRAALAKKVASTQGEPLTGGEPGIGVHGVASKSGIVAASSVALDKGKHVQVNTQQHSADSWESLYHDASVASPPRADVAQEVLQEVSSMMAIPVINPLVKGNNPQT